MRGSFDESCRPLRELHCFVGRDPGAYGPGFTLSSAPRTLFSGCEAGQPKIDQARDGSGTYASGVLDRAIRSTPEACVPISG